MSRITRNVAAVLGALALAVGMLAASEASAAKYKKITGPSNVKLRAARTVWRNISRGKMDVGDKTVRIVSKKRSERWTQTIKQVLHGQYVEGVSAGTMRGTKKNLDRAVADLFAGNGELSTASKATRSKLTNALYKAVKGNKVTVYTGGIWGAFDGDYMHITLRDRKTNQLMSIYGGYSE